MTPTDHVIITIFISALTQPSLFSFRTHNNSKFNQVGFGLDVDIFPYLSIKACCLGTHIYVLFGKKTILSYVLLSGGPPIIPCFETVVLYIQYATTKAQTQLRECGSTRPESSRPGQLGPVISYIVYYFPRYFHKGYQ